MINPIFIGIDVSKLHPGVHILPVGKSKHFSNTPKGNEAFADKPERIVLELTGGYAKPVLQTIIN
jgi:transposase